MTTTFDTLLLSLADNQKPALPGSNSLQFDQLSLSLLDQYFQGKPLDVPSFDSTNTKDFSGPSGLKFKTPQWMPLALGILPHPVLPPDDRPCIWATRELVFSNSPQPVAAVGSQSDPESLLFLPGYDRLTVGTHFFIGASPEFRGLSLPTPPTGLNDAGIGFGQSSSAFRYAGGFIGAEWQIASGLIVHPKSGESDCKVMAQGSLLITSKFVPQTQLDFSPPSFADSQVANSVDPKKPSPPRFWSVEAAEAVSFQFGAGGGGLSILANKDTLSTDPQPTGNIRFGIHPGGTMGGGLFSQWYSLLVAVGTGNAPAVSFAADRFECDGLIDVAAAGASLQLPIYADENAVKGDSGLAQFGLALVTSGAKLALCNGQSSKFVPLS